MCSFLINYQEVIISYQFIWCFMIKIIKNVVVYTSHIVRRYYYKLWFSWLYWYFAWFLPPKQCPEAFPCDLQPIALQFIVRTQNTVVFMLCVSKYHGAILLMLRVSPILNPTMFREQYGTWNLRSAISKVWFKISVCSL